MESNNLNDFISIPNYDTIVINKKLLNLANLHNAQGIQKNSESDLTNDLMTLQNYDNIMLSKKSLMNLQNPQGNQMLIENEKIPEDITTEKVKYLFIFFRSIKSKKTFHQAQKW